jgi:hypothetical protein
MMKVILVVQFQPSSYAAVPNQLNITYIHSSHHQIIVDDDSGLLDVLVSNPSLDQFFVMSGTYKTNIFLVFLFMIINLSLYTASFSPLLVLPSLFHQALPILMQCAHGVSLLIVQLTVQVKA